MIRQDLKAAGIAIEKNEKRVDFHALRVTMISHLAINGVPIQLAQKLARHSTPVLTANVYTHLDISDLQQAVEKLPAMTGTPATNGQPKTATGEHGQ
jgi:site-specific recombinase XerD